MTELEKAMLMVKEAGEGKAVEEGAEKLGKWARLKNFAGGAKTEPDSVRRAIAKHKIRAALIAAGIGGTSGGAGYLAGRRRKRRR